MVLAFCPSFTVFIAVKFEFWKKKKSLGFFSARYLTTFLRHIRYMWAVASFEYGLELCPEDLYLRYLEKKSGGYFEGACHY